MKSSAYELLRERFQGAREDRKGNIYIDCPNCDRAAKDKKCSFSPKGFNCFVCGECGSLPKLLQLLDVEWRGKRAFAAPSPQIVSPPPLRPWQLDPQKYLNEFMQDSAVVFEQWQKYRPLTAETIAKWEFGLGTLPSSACVHERLIYPARWGGAILAFRGRARFCLVCPKWLQSAGSKIVLWGIEHLRKAGPGQTVFVCESPVDAAHLMQDVPGAFAVAGTGGANTWRDKWTKILATCKPALVIVIYDNDLPGQGGQSASAEMARLWWEKHPSAYRLPKAGGPKVANKLLMAGLAVRMYSWTNAPIGADVGWLLTEGSEEILAEGLD